jgi:hypothetical protein
LSCNFGVLNALPQLKTLDNGRTSPVSEPCRGATGTGYSLRSKGRPQVLARYLAAGDRSAATCCVHVLLRSGTRPIYVQRFQAFDSSRPLRASVNGSTWTTTQRDYDSDSSKFPGRTDSRGCLKFVERDQPSHWPNSVDFLLGRTTAVISLSSLIFSTGMRKTLLEPVSLLCEGFNHGYRTAKGTASLKCRHRARSIHQLRRVPADCCSPSGSKGRPRMTSIAY